MLEKVKRAYKANVEIVQIIIYVRRKKNEPNEINTLKGNLLDGSEGWMEKIEEGLLK